MGDSSVIFLILLSALLVGSTLTSKESEPNGFIFTCPKTLKMRANNHLQLHRTGSLNAGVLMVDVSSNSGASLARKYFYILEGEKDLNLELFVGPIPRSTRYGHIVLHGTFSDTNYTIKGSDEVSFVDSNEFMVFIQTDKALYKEGQTVKFRVLCINREFKPVTKEVTDIWVEDPRGTRLFQWLGIFLEKGMKQFDFPLADEPTKGKWKISVAFKSEITSTVFEVKEYVLPKYEVKIITPPYVLINAKEIPITVCAKYTYGKPVKGELRLNITQEHRSASIRPFKEYIGQIDGCLDYMINTSLFRNEYAWKPKIEAAVEEFGTGVQRSDNKFIRRHVVPLKLAFNPQRQFYKPGLPYYGRLKVNHPDRTPAEDEPIQICYELRKNGTTLSQGSAQCRKYTSDNNGFIDFIIPPHSGNYIEMNCKALSLKYTEDKLGGSNYRPNLIQPQANLDLTPWYSPSQSFIQLQPVNEPLNCGITKKFKVLYTFEADANYTFKYQVLSKGQTVLTKEAEVRISVDEDISSLFEDKDMLVNTETLQNFPPGEESLLAEESPDDLNLHARYIGEFDIEAEISPSWSPVVHFLIYYVRQDKEVVADAKKLEIEKCFKNQVKFRFGDDVKQPATKTSLRISASPNSLCGIKVVDKSVSLLDSSDQLTKEKIFSKLESFDIVEDEVWYGCSVLDRGNNSHLSSRKKLSTTGPSNEWDLFLSSYNEDSLAAFQNSGYLVISDLKVFIRPCNKELGSTPRLKPNPELLQPTKSVVKVRNYFPETWLFRILMTDENGEYLSKETLPHTITEWVGNAFCINEEDGLGLSNWTTIRGFQAFFLSLTLPHSAIRGEIITATVSIFSYVKDSLPITISLEGLDGFQIVGESIDGDVCVQPGSSTNLKVQLKAVRLNRQNITVRAQTSQSDICGNFSIWNALAKDAISESVLIEAEGWPAEDVKSVLFCPKDQENGVFQQEFSLVLPDDVVPDSSRGFLDVTETVLAKSLMNLENLVLLPTGCGEQNMIKFAPNVVALDVLTQTNQLTNDLKSRIIKNLKKGAQRQLQYRHPDGSFSAFGTRDREGSMFLTAFVLRYFTAAVESITIYFTIMSSMQYWIVSKQQADGCFPDVGIIILRELKGTMGKANSQGVITAYVLISLIKSGYQDESVWDSALTCMQNDQAETFYATFLYAYAESLAGKRDSARERIKSAKNKAITKGSVTYYHDLNAARSQDIETASYAVLAMLNLNESVSETAAIVRYLTQNMNPQGGFYSTQDTCVGLEALGEFAKLTFKDPVDITINVRGGLQKEIRVTEDEKLLVKRYKIKDIPSNITIEATGSGCAIIQSILKYNTQFSSENNNFNIEVEGHYVDDVCKHSEIGVTVSYVPEGKKTGMAVVEVKMISGWIPDKESLQQLLNKRYLELMRYEVDSNVVVFYFSEISNAVKRFFFKCERDVDVEESEPGRVKVYDYYNRDVSSSTNYTLSVCNWSRKTMH